MEDTVVTIMSAIIAVALGAGAFWYGWRRFERVLPPERRQEFKLFEKAMRLERVDPVAAERLLDQHFTGLAQNDARERDALRARAATDRGAAELLRELLLGDLAANTEARKDFQRRASTDPNAHNALLAIDADSKKLHAEIQSLDQRLGRGDS